MSYTLYSQYNSPNYTAAANVPAVYGMERKVEFFGIHWWGEPAHKPTFKGVVDYLCRVNGNTSAHVVVSAGEVAWIVNGWDASWAGGSAYANARGVHWELNPRCSEEDYQTAAEALADGWITYGWQVPLRPHNDFHSTECPGDKSGRGYDLAKLHRMTVTEYNKKKGVKPAPAKKPAPVKKPGVVKPASNTPGFSGITYTVEPGQTLWGIASEIYSAKRAKEFIGKIKALNGLKSDSIRKGQKLKLPVGIYWSTDPGDTINKIGRRFGVHGDWLVKRNPVLKGVGYDVPLFAGQVITIG